MYNAQDGIIVKAVIAENVSCLRWYYCQSSYCQSCQNVSYLKRYYCQGSYCCLHKDAKNVSYLKWYYCQGSYCCLHKAANNVSYLKWYYCQGRYCCVLKAAKYMYGRSIIISRKLFVNLPSKSTEWILCTFRMTICICVPGAECGDDM